MACFFCGGAPTTREHVFGKAWSRSLFQPDTTLYEFRQAKGYRDEPKHVTNWRKKDVDAVVNCACGVCNHGWMERLDKQAQPLVTPFTRGEPGRLASLREITLVAAWATKIGMCLASVVVETEGQRREAGLLRERPLPPDSVWVWMGASLAQFPQMWSHQYQLSDRPVLTNGVEGYVSTFKIHGVVFQVAYLPEPIDPSRKPGEDWGQHLVQLWPLTFRQVVFPPVAGKQLNEIDLILLSRSFALGPFA